MDIYRAALDAMRMSVLAIGSVIIFAGILRGVVEARGSGGRGRVARQIGEHAALGLDYFVGATIINLVLNPTLTAVATTTLTIAIRKTLTFALGRTARSG